MADIGRAILGTVTIDYHTERACVTDRAPYDDHHVHVKFNGDEFFYHNGDLITDHPDHRLLAMRVEVNMRHHRLAQYAQGKLPEYLTEMLGQVGILRSRDETLQDLELLAGLRALARDMPQHALPSHSTTYTGEAYATPR